MASSTIQWATKARVLSMQGNTSWRAASADSTQLYQPYGILIVGYGLLAVVSAVMSSSPLSSLEVLYSSGSTITLTDGTLTLGTVGNRQFFAICPPGVTLVQQ